MTSTHVVPKSTQSTSRESLFQPSVTVCDDGTIHVDWFDCYVSTQSIGESGLIDDVAYEEPPGHPHSALLDSIIMRGKSDADALRALADYIDAQS